MLFRQLSSEFLSEFVDVLTEDAGILFGKIDMFEDAMRRRYCPGTDKKSAA
jgi:hypothetical protein